MMMLTVTTLIHDLEIVTGEHVFIDS